MTQHWQGEPVQPYKIHRGTAVEGQILYRKQDPITGLPPSDTDRAADWAQDPNDVLNGRKVMYPGWQMSGTVPAPPFDQVGLVSAGVAPDNAFEFLAHYVASATDELLIETHTFDNPDIAALLIQAAERGVTVRLLFEGGPPGGVSDQAKLNCLNLEAVGGECWIMAKNDVVGVSDRYDYLHAKYVIIDRQRVIVSSENLSPNSMPADPKDDGTWGRRGVLIGIDSEELANYFYSKWRLDFAPLRYGDIQPVSILDPIPPGYSPPPATNPTTYTVRYRDFPVVTDTVSIEVIQSPENSLAEFVALIGRAQNGDEIYVQQLTERPVWQLDDPNGQNVRLMALVEAARRGADVKLLLDEYFDDGDDLLSNLSTCLMLREIAENEALQLACQLANPAGLGIHNKMILLELDGQGFVHVGSINGTEQSFKGNREVGLTIESNQLFAYLKDVFERDWIDVIFLPIVSHDYIGPANHVLISEVLVDPFGGSDAAEFIELVNPTTFPIDISGYSLSDAIRPDEFADLKRFPANTIIGPNTTLVVAQQAVAFQEQFGLMPDYEILNSSELAADLLDDPAWGDPKQYLRLGNSGDVVVLRDAEDQLVDVVAYGSRAFPGRDQCDAPPTGSTLQRRPYWRNLQACQLDFEIWPAPNPGELLP